MSANRVALSVLGDEPVGILWARVFPVSLMEVGEEEIGASHQYCQSDGEYSDGVDGLRPPVAASIYGLYTGVVVGELVGVATGEYLGLLVGIISPMK